MPRQKRPTGKRSKKGFVLGHAGFAKISAVEGVRLKPAMKKRASDASSEGLSPGEYRRVIVRAYRKD
jgi:hypothetical protein